MTGMLSANWKASLLAHSLWEFYNHQLYCTIRADDGEPNRHCIDGIRSPETIDTIRVRIAIRDDGRREEGLVHELLHANLIPLGYPRFWFKECTSEKWRLAGGIINLADHLVMQPIYLSFGYSIERFGGPSRPLSGREKRVADDLEGIEASLLTPHGYLTHISAYLRSHDLQFEPLFLAGKVVRQRSEHAGVEEAPLVKRM